MEEKQVDKYIFFKFIHNIERFKIKIIIEFRYTEFRKNKRIDPFDDNYYMYTDFCVLDRIQQLFDFNYWQWWLMNHRQNLCFFWKQIQDIL